MRPDLQANFLGQNRELACQQRADAKRSAGVRDAGFPILGIEAKLFERIGYLTFEFAIPASASSRYRATSVRTRSTLLGKW